MTSVQQEELPVIDASQCLSKTVAETTAKDLVLATLFIGAITEKDKLLWTITVQVQGRPVHFKMDTGGAEVTVISEQDFQALKGGKLEPPNLTYQALDVIGLALKDKVGKKLDRLVE